MPTESALRRSSEASPRTFGKFQLQKKLATGGMAEVWLARQSGIEGFHKACVVKMILPHLADDPEFVQMFLNEAKIAARLNHPSIAQIFELGAENGTYFIAMEFVHGEDLGRTMRKAWTSGQWVAAPLSMRIVASACEGLHYAHTKNDESGRPLKVVHRDISPQNILISFDGSVKLVDFGIAKAADQASMTKSGAIKGKFSYMSPEQAAGKPLDHRSDVFSIGLVLYELLTGVRPLKRDNELATLQAALECKIEAPSQVADIADDIDDLVMRALAKAPADRYPDARALQMALEEYLVSHGWVAGSVQLSELMRTLFQDRLAEEERLGYANPESDEVSVPSVSGERRPWDEPPQDTLLREEGDGLPEAEADADETVPPDDGGWVAPKGAEIPGPRRSMDELPRRNTGSVPGGRPRPPSGSGAQVRRQSAARVEKRVSNPSSKAIPRKSSTGKVKARTTPRPERNEDDIPEPRRQSVERQDLAKTAQKKNSAPVGLFLTVLAALGVMAYFVFQQATGAGGVILDLAVEPMAQVSIRHHKSENKPEIVELGKTPFRKESGAHEKDTIIFQNSALGLYHEETIPLQLAFNTFKFHKRFAMGRLRLPRNAPQYLWNATIMEGGREVGNFHPDRPAMELCEGTHTFVLAGAGLKKPVTLPPVKIVPNQETTLTLPPSLMTE